MGSLDVTGIAIVLKSLPTLPLVFNIEDGTFLRRNARIEGGGIVT